MPTPPLELETMLKEAHIPGASVATVSSNRSIATAKAGVINTDTQEPVTDTTIFQAASLSKPVFAYIVLKMVEDGKFSRPGETPESGLDRPLHEICDFGPPHLQTHPNYKLLTPRILLSHQAGLPNWFRGDEAYVATAGTRFDYSGEAHCFLNDVVEHIAGKKPLHEISREIFDKEPLKMSHSGFVPPPEGSIELEQRALGHKADNAPDKRKPPPGPILANPAASLVTTAEDYAKFLNACLHDEFIRKHMFEPQLSLAGYDLALMSTLPDNNKAKAQNGIIYLSEDGQYIVQDPKGVVQEGTLNTREIDLSQLQMNLNNADLKSAILKVTSNAGHTFLAGKDQKALDAKVSDETLRQMRWGIGMGLQTADNGDTIAFHWGDNETSRAFTAINLRTNEAVACFTNSANGPRIFRQIAEPVVGNLNAVGDWLSKREELDMKPNPTQSYKQEFKHLRQEVPGYGAPTESSSRKEREKFTPLSTTPKPWR